ncbi:hypothetical protein BY996DRAFT_6408331 [Phakopsora pachyrhizi]|nr:hypothetical protein BY996DRAFT_6408331 [Phakopsora pachyrhizi]
MHNFLKNNGLTLIFSGGKCYGGCDGDYYGDGDGGGGGGDCYGDCGGGDSTSAANFSKFCSASSSAYFSATFIALPSVILLVGCSISLRDLPSSTPLRAGAASVSPDRREKDTKI